MNKESPALQRDMFTGQLADTRSSYRKRLDRERNQPQQMQMFRAREVVDIGASVRPWLKDLPSYPLVLESEDVRTEEEVERDLMREAEALTVPLFVEETPAEITPEPGIPPPLTLRGYRVRARMRCVPVRQRAALEKAA